MTQPLSSAWTQQIKDVEARKDFEVIVRNSTLLLTRLKEILEDRERQLTNSALTLEDFKDPNWSHRQAFRNGCLSELKKLKELIPF